MEKMLLPLGEVDRIIADEWLITRIVFSYNGVIKLRHLGVHYYLIKDDTVRRIDAFKLRAKFRNADPSMLHLFLFGDNTYIETVQERTDELSIIE
jgi:hypothetical protein